MDEKTKLDNTIKVLASILEKNKNSAEVKEAYDKIKSLEEKRNIKEVVYGRK